MSLARWSDMGALAGRQVAAFSVVGEVHAEVLVEWTPGDVAVDVGKGHRADVVEILGDGGELVSDYAPEVGRWCE